MTMPEYIGNLPTDIEKISKEIQDNTEYKNNLVCPENLTEFFHDVKKVKKGSKINVKSHKDLIEE